MWHGFALQPGLLAAVGRPVAQAGWLASEVTASSWGLLV